MKIQDIRRARLAQLIEERFDGSQAKFIDATGESQSEVSGLLKAKSFGEKKARKLEMKCRLPELWLDTAADAAEAATSKGAGTTILADTSIFSAITIDQDLLQVSLVYATNSELALLTLYRQATAEGKALILSAAETADKQLQPSVARHQP